jgi:fructose-1,6-bisphosphatase/sedoheptulose 1,7-bisphosphatase-like protein
VVVSKQNARVMVTMPQELKDKLEDEANKENRSLSNYIVTILQKRRDEANEDK